ncbi:hypothetical protein, partial [Neobacillus cucumis]|uniref:hypothetical protein n=1 Tax=Neobacillus cucumis TaxID=1740721 RepID=UPI0035F4E814
VERSIKSTFQLLKMWTFSVPSPMRLWGLPCPVLPQESTAFRSNQNGFKIKTTFNIAKKREV